MDRVRSNVLRINAARGSVNSSSEVLTATPGKVGTHRIVKATVGEYAGELVVDLGFSSYFKPDKKLKFEDRDIVQVSKGTSLRGSVPNKAEAISVLKDARKAKEYLEKIL